MSKENATRRQILKSVGGVVGLTGSIHGVTASTGKRVRVPKYIDEDGVVESWLVPRGWHKHLKAARRQNDSLRDRLGNEDQVKSIATVANGGTLDGKPKLDLRVEIEEGESCERRGTRSRQRHPRQN